MVNQILRNRIKILQKKHISNAVINDGIRGNSSKFMIEYIDNKKMKSMFSTANWDMNGLLWIHWN